MTKPDMALDALKEEFTEFSEFVYSHNREQPVPWPIAELFVRRSTEAIDALEAAKAVPIVGDDLMWWKARAIQAEAIVDKFLTQPAARPVVPHGYKLVPIEPTPEMPSSVGMMNNYDVHANLASPDADHVEWYQAILCAAPAPTVVQGEPVQKFIEGFLCYAWGESDLPIAKLAASREDVRQFVIAEWTGDPGDDCNGAMEDFDAHDWKDNPSLRFEFEIGGVEITKATLYTHPSPSELPVVADKQDAARYRWLNKKDNFLIQIDDKTVRLKCGEPLDSWIDAAMAAGGAK